MPDCLLIDFGCEEKMTEPGADVMIFVEKNWGKFWRF
jgi:hypothetical protein